MDNLFEVAKVWLEAVGGDVIQDESQILKAKGLKKIIEAEKCGNYSKFLSKSFPNFKSKSPVLSAALSLVYAAFSANATCAQLREQIMCHLDTNIQFAVQEFLQNFTTVDWKQVDEAFVTSASSQMPILTDSVVMSPGEGKPSRLVLSPETESPLQRFFRTPRRKNTSKNRRWTCTICSNGDRIKQMEVQMEEDETERNLLIQSQNNLKSVVADLEKKLQRELTRNENLEANSLSIETDLLAKDKIIVSLEEKCQENLRNLSALQDDLFYAQKCLTETAERLSLVEDANEKLNSNIGKTELKYEEAIREYQEIFALKTQLEEIIHSKNVIEQELFENSVATKFRDGSVEPEFNNSGVAENLGDQLLMDARKEISELLEKIANGEEMLTSLSEENKQIKEEKSKLEEIIAGLREEKGKCFSELQQSKNDATKLEEKLMASTEEIEKRVGELKIIAEKLETFEGLVRKKDEVVSGLRLEIREKSELVCETERKFEEKVLIESRLKSEIETLKSELCLKEKSVENLTELLKNEEGLVADLKGEVKGVKVSVKKLLKEKGIAEELRRKLESDVAKLLEELRCKDAEKTSLEKVVFEQKEILVKNSGEICEKAGEISALICRETELLKNVTKLEAIVSEKTETVSEKSAEISILKKFLDDNDEILESKERELQNVRKQVEDLIEELKKSLEDLEASLKDFSKLSDDFSLLQENNRRLESAMGSLQAQLSEKENRLSNLTEENEKLTKNLVEINENVESLRKMLSESLEEKLSLEKVIVDLQSSLDEKTNDLLKKQSDFEDLIEELKKSREDFEASLKNFSELSDDFSLLQKNNRRLESAMGSLQAQLSEKESRLSNLTEENEKLSKNFNENSDTLQKSLEEKLSLENVIADLKSSLETTNSELLKKQTEFDNLSVELKNLQTKTADLLNELKNFEAENQQLQNQQSENRSQITVLSETVENLQKEVSQLQVDNNQKQEEILASLEREENLKQQLTNQTNNSAKLSKTLETLAQNETALQKQQTENESKIQQLREENQNLKESSQKLQELFETSQKKITDLSKESESQQQNFKLIEDELTKKLSEQTTALLNLSETVEHLKKHREELKETLEKLCESLNKKEESLIKKDAEIAEKQTELSKLSTDFKESSKNFQEKISNLQETITNFDSKINSLESTNKVLETSLSNLTKEKEKLEKTTEESLKKIQEKLSEKESLIEQQAVEFNREKMQLIAQLNLHQRESATAVRNLEAKNLALDEVKKVAMSKVNELLASHCQLRSELDDLVANKTAVSDEARTKSLDLAAALADVENFKTYVRGLKKEKNELVNVIEDMKVKMKMLIGQLTGNDEIPADYEGIVDKFRAVIEERKKSLTELSNVVSKLQSELLTEKTERKRIQTVLDSISGKTKFWANPLIQQLVENLNNSEKFKESLVKLSTEFYDGDCQDVENVLDRGKDQFIRLVNFVDSLRKVSEGRQQVQLKLEEDYQTMEKRMLSLAEINSRLSTEIVKAKQLSSVELSLHETELTSLKTTVSQLNKKFEEVSIEKSKLEQIYRKISEETEGLRKTVGILKESLRMKSEEADQFAECFSVKERVDKLLNFLKSAVPEMATVVATLQQRRDSLVESLTNREKLSTVIEGFNDILLNLELIETKKPTDDLSDSLEEVVAQDKTFQIVNLHDETFAMPPKIAEPSKTDNQRVWTVSPPSKRKPPQIKQERSVNGQSWVIPVGPAPLKPVRKSETTEKDLLGENDALRTAVADLERKRMREREQYEEGRQAIRLKYEKQLETMKDEMKSLYNQEITKHKSEQSKMAEELKKKNEELRKQNAAYKEDIDDLRSQLWSLGDKLLLNEQTKKRDEERLNLSRQLDQINLQSVDSWKSGTTTDTTDSSRNQPRFPSMPVEDEEEIFDNRCLEELKAGPLPQNRQTRLTELQMRNSLCLPHLKSSYPVEMQFFSPLACKETDVKTTLPFIESESLTDSSDPSMTKSLLPAEKSKKKEQTSYKRPGPPTPSKNGRPSLGGDVKLTPKRPLREQNQRGTPNRLKALFSSKSGKRESLGGGRGHDENTAPTTPRVKGLRIFQRKPFGGRDF